MIAALDELRNVLPARFEGDDYQARRRAIDEQFRSGNEEALEALSKKAQSQNIALLRTPTGFAMAPMHEGKVVKPEVFNALPEAMRRDVETKIAGAREGAGPDPGAPAASSDKKRRGAAERAQRGRGQDRHPRCACTTCTHRVSDMPEAAAYLEAAGHDMVRNVGLFLATGEEENAIVKQPVDTAHDPRFRRYMVNVMAAQRRRRGGRAAGRGGQPHLRQPGRARRAHRPDGHAGHRFPAHQARRAAQGQRRLSAARCAPAAAVAVRLGSLKRAIKAREVRIEQPVETAGLISTQTLDPEPIPLDVKVVLFGDRELYYLLAAHDPGLPGVCSRCRPTSTTPSSARPRTTTPTPALIASVVKEHGLKPVDAAGVARVIDEGARLADDREKLSIEIGRISDIVREADYWSGQAKRKITSRQDVSRAIDEQIQRADRLRDRAQETINRGIVLVDTEGAKVGQINGLSVLQLGSFSFGRPSRITARVRLGAGPRRRHRARGQARRRRCTPRA